MRSTDWMKGALFGFGFTVLVGIGAGAVAAHPDKPKKVAVDKDVLSHGVQEALAELEQIRVLNDRNRDRRIRLRIDNRISALRADLTAIESHLADAKPVRDRAWDRDRDRDRDRYDDDSYDYDDDDDDYDRGGHVSYTMSDGDIDVIVLAVQASFSSSAKLAVIREGVSGRWISVTQLARLMDELAYSADRVDCAAALHANLADPQNFYQVYSHLPFEADRDSLRQRITVR